jgi:hypothetical protein
MSAFDNKHSLFLEPNTKQYGSHMVMNNVHKQSKCKYVNIDSKFRDEYNNTIQTTNGNADLLANLNHVSNYNINLPERVNEVRTINVTNIEVPMSFYNISANLGNNYFKTIVSGNETIITISDGNYTDSSLTTALNNALTSAGIGLTFTVTNNARTTVVSTGSVEIHFDINSSGTSDKSRFKSKLGWLLGFRNTNYTVTTSTTTSEHFLNLHGTKYLYLAIEEFNKGNQNSFVSPLFSSFINKNVIARVAIDKHTYPYGSILPANKSNGLLTSDVRCYTGKVDLQKFNVSLLNEDGIPVDLNGLDFSFCLEVEHE